jgi:hypothetical protein
MTTKTEQCPTCGSEMEPCANVRVRDGEVYDKGWLCAKCQITSPGHSVSSEASPTAAATDDPDLVGFSGWYETNKLWTQSLPREALRFAYLGGIQAKPAPTSDEASPTAATPHEFHNEACGCYSPPAPTFVPASTSATEPIDTTGRPESTGFEVLVKIHTKDADKFLDCPETLQWIVGHAIDHKKGSSLQEEIDYTLEVRRVYR